MLLGVLLCYWFAKADIPTWLWAVTWVHFGISFIVNLKRKRYFS